MHSSFSGMKGTLQIIDRVRRKSLKSFSNKQAKNESQTAEDSRKTLIDIKGDSDLFNLEMLQFFM